MTDRTFTITINPQVTTPSWFTALPYNTWTALGNTIDSVVQTGGGYPPYPANYTTDDITGAGNGAGIDQSLRQMLIVGTGGHSGWWGGDGYILDLALDAAPAWKRIVTWLPSYKTDIEWITSSTPAPNPSNPLALEEHTMRQYVDYGAGVGANTTNWVGPGGVIYDRFNWPTTFCDGVSVGQRVAEWKPWTVAPTAMDTIMERPRSPHTCWSIHYSNGKMWYPTQNGSNNGSGRGSRVPYSFDVDFVRSYMAANGGTPYPYGYGNKIPWTYYAPVNSGMAPSTFPISAIDTGTGRIWTQDPAGRTFFRLGTIGAEAGQNVTYTLPFTDVNNRFKNGPNAICPDAGRRMWVTVTTLDNPTTPTNEIVVYDLDAIESGSTVVDKVLVTGLNLLPWARLRDAVECRRGYGMVWHQPSLSFLLFNCDESPRNPTTTNSVLFKLSPPLNGDGTWNRSGSWSCSSVRVSGVPDVCSTAPTGITGSSFSRFNIVRDMGNGESLLMSQGLVDTKTWFMRLSNEELQDDLLFQDASMWASVGVTGGIPTRTTVGQTVSVAFGNDSTDARAEIQAKIDATPVGQVCFIPAGTYRVNGALNVKSGVTIRGAGRTTIIKQTGTATGLIQFGTASVSVSNNKTISSGATKGSTSIVVNNTTGISVGTSLVITEVNDSAYPVSNDGTANTPATWVDGWNTLGTRAKGQIVKVTAVSGTTLTISPALYSNYSNTPWANYFTPAVTQAGVESLTVYATNSNTPANFYFGTAEDCWIYDIYSDFCGLNHVDMRWSYRCQIDKCHFYDGFSHSNECNVALRHKSSACLVQNSIFERMLVGIYVQWGAAGNAICYNYFTGGYNDNASTGARYLTNDIEPSHGAHPQYNLIEGNIGAKFRADSYWGTSSDTVVLRNYFSGFRTSSNPYSVRGTATTTFDLTQANYAVDIYEGQRGYSVVGNIIGNNGNWNTRSPVRKRTNPEASVYDVPYVFRLGYTATADTGGLATLVNPSGTLIDHGNWDSVTDSVTNDPTLSTHTIPTSLVYSSKPSWWDDAAPWPPVDPQAVPADLSTLTNPAKIRHASTYANLVGHFETGTDGQQITPTVLDSCFSGTGSDLWVTVTNPNAQTQGTTTNLTISTSAARAPGQSLIVPSGAVITSSTRGFRAAHNTDGAIQIANPNPTGSFAALGCHFRWGGTRINWSPRDIIAMIDNTGGYQYMQATDNGSAGGIPNLHIHWQPYTVGNGVGSAINVTWNRWYFIRMKHVPGGQTSTLQVYDAENNYALVGSSSGAVSGTSNVGSRIIQFGMLKYSSGTAQWFDFDNIIINWDGTPVPVPST